MTVYMIYSTADKIFNTGSVGCNELYAMTNKKKLLKRFKEQRNMELFRIKTIECSPEEYAQMGNQYRETILENVTYRSKKQNPYPESEYETFGNCVDEYTICVTYLEKSITNEQIDSFYENPMENIDLFNPLILSKNIRRLLCEFGLDFMYRLKLFPMIDSDFIYEPDSYEFLQAAQNSEITYMDMLLLRDQDSDMNPPDAWIDQMEVFLKLFGRLFKQ